MRTTPDQFHPMRGHVVEGCQIATPSGRIFTLRSSMKGWQVCGPDGLPVSGDMQSAHEVTFFIVNGLSHRG